MSSKNLTTIGRRERIDLPTLGLRKLRAKIDSGAYGCSIHCHHIKTKKLNGVQFLYFNLLDPSHPKYEQTIYEMRDFKRKKVKNSFGQSEERYVIKLPIMIAGRLLEANFSLSNRSEMKYPILIGRELLKNNFLIDVSKINLGTKPKKKKSKKQQ